MRLLMEDERTHLMLQSVGFVSSISRNNLNSIRCPKSHAWDIQMQLASFAAKSIGDGIGTVVALGLVGDREREVRLHTCMVSTQKL